MPALFLLGRTVATPGALEALEEANQTPHEFLTRHLSGDWGDLCDEDKAANDYAVENEGRIFSSYFTSNNTKLWVITECDHSVTTLLLPSEY